MVNKQEQISIGKKYAGKKVEVDEYPDGTVILKPVEVVSEFEMKLLKDKAFQNRLKAFDRCQYATKPAETDLATLLRTFSMMDFDQLRHSSGPHSP